MLFRFAADLVVVLHFLFVVFVVAGGLMVWFKPRLAWLHIPAALWGAIVITMGWICPLTPLENWLLQEAGLQGYRGGFIERYIVSLIYPAGLTRQTQVVLGLLVLVLNVSVYSALFYRRLKRRHAPPQSSR